MSFALISPGPEATSGASTSSASVCMRTTMSFRLRTMSVTSSFTPGTVENSCATPSTRTLVIAAPPSEDSSTRRMLLPNVYPNPLSRGSTVKVPRFSSTFSALILGTWNSVVMRSSVVDLSRRGLLGVQLDDELLLDRCRDLGALRDPEHLGGKGLVVG